MYLEKFKEIQHMCSNSLMESMNNFSVVKENIFVLGEAADNVMNLSKVT